MLAVIMLLSGCAWAQDAIISSDFDNGLEDWTTSASEGAGEVQLADDGAGGQCALLHKTLATEQHTSVGIRRTVTVEPNSVYEISLRQKCVLKEGIVGYAFRVFLTGGDLSENRSIPASADWKPFTWRFSTGPEAAELSVFIALTYSSGDAWVDNVTLRKVGASIEAEDLPDRASAQLVTDDGLSGEQGLRLGPDGSVSTTLPLQAGPWEVQVYGEGDAEDGLTAGAVTVSIGSESHTVDLYSTSTDLHGRNALFQLDQSGPETLTITRAPGYTGTLVLDRIAWRAHDGPARLKKLYIDTTVVRDGRPNAVIIISDDAAMQTVARDLQTAIRETSGATLPIVRDTQWMAGDYQAQNAIAVGNLLQNKLSERLYCLWYTYEDCWYPGEGGWVVRTVHDPWGTGSNVIVAAGSDEAGTVEAAGQLAGLLGRGQTLTIGHTIAAEMAPEVAAGIENAVGRPDPEYARSSVPRRSQRSLMSSAARAGVSYLYSGDPRRARMAVIYLLGHKRNPELGADTHMELWKTIRAWDNIEECPEFTDDERLEVTNYLLHVLRSEEGINQGMFVSALAHSTVRHNHHMLAAMDAYYGGEYFRKYYRLPEADDWLAKARFIFSTQELEDKGQDESGDYELSTALRPLLPFAYTEPGYQFLPSGTARRFIDRCVVALDNRFASSGHGDCWDVDCFGPLPFGVGAWYYHDTGYQYILEQRRALRPDEQNAMQIQPPFRMDGVVPAERPARFEGVTLAPLNHAHYDLYSGGQNLKWNVPWEGTFDKISFRTRFEPSSQYLLLDGISCGSHGHSDANCLVRFTDNDRVWLVDDSYTEGPFLTDHNGVVVTRDGIADQMPACARLDAAVDFGDIGLTRTTLPDHSGADWERNVIWLKENCFVVLDRMEALSAGNYGFRCLWRTLGTGDLDGRTLVTRQMKLTPERDDTMYLVTGGDTGVTVTPETEVFGAKWRGYEYAQPVVNICSQDVSRNLQAGEQFTFADLFYASNIDEPHSFDLTKLDDTAALVTGDETMLVGVADGGYRIGGLSIDGGTFALRQGSLSVADTTAVTLDGRTVYSGDAPVSLRLDLEDGRLITEPAARTYSNETAPADAFQQRTETTVALGDRTDFAAELQQASTLAAAAAGGAQQQAAQTTPNVTAAWQFDAGSGVRALIADGDRVALGTEGGAGVVLDANGRELWRVDCGGRVNAVSAGDINGDGADDLAFASDDGTVLAVDASGNELWTHSFGGDVTRGGRAGEVRDVLCSDLDGDGRAEVAASPNNGWMYILSPDGEELTRFQGSAGYAVLDGLRALDVNGNGRKTVFSFSSSGSFGHGWDCELDGTSTRFSTDGWPSQIRDVAMVDFTGDGGVGFAHGTSRGNVYYRKPADGVLGNSKVFAAGSGLSAVAGLSREGRPGLVAVGLEMSYVHVLDADGQLVWSAPTEAPVTDLAFTGGDNPMLVVGTAGGTVLFFDDAGELLGRFVAGDRVNVVADGSGGVLAAGADGTVRSLRVSR